MPSDIVSINSLPPEILAEVLNYLSDEILTVRQTNKHFRAASFNTIMFKHRVVELKAQVRKVLEKKLGSIYAASYRDFLLSGISEKIWVSNCDEKLKLRLEIQLGSVFCNALKQWMDSDEGLKAWRDNNQLSETEKQDAQFVQQIKDQVYLAQLKKEFQRINGEIKLQELEISCSAMIEEEKKDIAFLEDLNNHIDWGSFLSHLKKMPEASLNKQFFFFMAYFKVPVEWVVEVFSENYLKQLDLNARLSLMMTVLVCCPQTFEILTRENRTIPWGKILEGFSLKDLQLLREHLLKGAWREKNYVGNVWGKSYWRTQENRYTGWSERVLARESFLKYRICYEFSTTLETELFACLQEEIVTQKRDAFVSLQQDFSHSISGKTYSVSLVVRDSVRIIDAPGVIEVITPEIPNCFSSAVEVYRAHPVRIERLLAEQDLAEIARKVSGKFFHALLERNDQLPCPQQLFLKNQHDMNDVLRVACDKKFPSDIFLHLLDPKRVPLSVILEALKQRDVDRDVPRGFVSIFCDSNMSIVKKQVFTLVRNLSPSELKNLFSGLNSFVLEPLCCAAWELEREDRAFIKRLFSLRAMTSTVRTLCENNQLPSEALSYLSYWTNTRIALAVLSLGIYPLIRQIKQAWQNRRVGEYTRVPTMLEPNESVGKNMAIELVTKDPETVEWAQRSIFSASSEKGPDAPMTMENPEGYVAAAATTSQKEYSLPTILPTLPSYSIAPINSFFADNNPYSNVFSGPLFLDLYLATGERNGDFIRSGSAGFVVTEWQEDPIEPPTENTFRR